MNLVQFFTREEPIAGLEISDIYLRLSLLEFADKEKQKLKIKIKFLIEEPLPEGIISEGVIKDQNNFILSLKKLFKKNEKKIRYVIISLPADNVYSRLFSFPKTIEEGKIEETMKLVVDFQLPVTPAEVYLDWEKVESAEQNEALLAAIPQKIIDGYLEALALAGLNVVAVEFHPLSFSRVLDLPKNKAVLIKIPNKENIGIFIIKNETLRFSRFLPKTFLSEKNLLDVEIKKITEFYEAENKESISKVIDSGELKIIKIFDHPEINKNNSTWLVSLGAAFRGLLPRVEDTLISLMPVGTEKAYERQKAIIFAKFMQGVIIGLSLFFSIAFIGAWLLLVTVQKNFSQQLNNLSFLPVASDAVELETKTNNFNSLIVQTSDILQKIPQWSPVLEELKSRVISGISIANFSLPSPEALMTISGVAQNRSRLNLFKKSLTESSFFTEVNMPLTNLEQKENISFSVTFRLKNPAALYSW